MLQPCRSFEQSISPEHEAFPLQSSCAIAPARLMSIEQESWPVQVTRQPRSPQSMASPLQVSSSSQFMVKAAWAALMVNAPEQESSSLQLTVQLTDESQSMAA